MCFQNEGLAQEEIYRILANLNLPNLTTITLKDKFVMEVSNEYTKSLKHKKALPLIELDLNVIYCFPGLHNIDK